MQSFCRANPTTRRRTNVDDFISTNPSGSVGPGLTRSTSPCSKAPKYHMTRWHFAVPPTGPSVRQHAYFDRRLNDMIYQLPSSSRRRTSRTSGSCNGPETQHRLRYPRCGHIPDLLPISPKQRSSSRATPTQRAGAEDDWPSSHDGNKFSVRSTTSRDRALTDYQTTYGAEVTKDDIFYYVYGLLHSPDYLAKFAADLKKMLASNSNGRLRKGFP